MTMHWFSLLLVFAAGVLFAMYWRQHRQPGSAISLLLSAGAIGLVGTGGFFPALLIKLRIVDDSALWAWWLGGLALVTLFGMCLVVIVSGLWWAPLAYAAAAILLLALGCLSGEAISRGLL